MSRVKVVDEETGQEGYIDDEDESVPFEPIQHETSLSPTPSFVTQEAPQATDPAPAPAAPERRRAEAAGVGAMRGATYDYSDEIVGALNSAFSDDTYEQGRDLVRSYQNDLEEQEPAYTTGGQIGGALLGSAVMPGARGAGLIGRAAQGVAEGALAGRGASENDEDPSRDMAVGGIVGGLGGIAGNEIGRVGGALSQRVAPYLDNVADAWRGRTPGSDTGAILERNGEAELGRNMRQQGIGDRLFSGPREVAEDSARVIERNRPTFDAVHAEADRLGLRGSLTPQQVEMAAANMSTAPTGPVPIGANAALRDLRSGGPLNDPGGLMNAPAPPPSTTVRRLHDLQQNIDRKLDVESSTLPDREASRADISRAIDDALTPELRAEWRPAKAAHSTAARAMNAANRTQTRMANRGADGTALGLGGLGLALAAPATTMTVGGEDGGAVQTAGGLGLGGALALGAGALGVRGGRGPRLLEEFARKSGQGALLGGAALRLGGDAVQAGSRTSAARREAAMNPEVERILDEALGSDQDPAVTNFKLQYDEDWRRSGVEEEQP